MTDWYSEARERDGRTDDEVMSEIRLREDTARKKPPWGSVERIADCRRHRSLPTLDLATGKPSGQYGCWFCGAAL